MSGPNRVEVDGRVVRRPEPGVIAVNRVAAWGFTILGGVGCALGLLGVEGVSVADSMPTLGIGSLWLLRVATLRDVEALFVGIDVLAVDSDRRST